MDDPSSGGLPPQAAWMEPLTPFLQLNFIQLPSSVTAVISTGLFATSFAFGLIGLTLFLFRANNNRNPSNMANGPTANGNGHAANGKPVDPSADFKGDIKVDNKPPTKEQLEKIADVTVLDVNKKSHTFKSLYADNENGPRRVLIVFLRHFFCGNCQEYVRVLSTSLPPSTLATLSPPTSIIIIGCGSPDLLSWYATSTGCAFPIYADPTRRLYHQLRMTSTLSLGPQNPQYMQKSLVSMAVRSFLQELRSGRKMLSGGDYRQVGGEFLFERGKVSWCHRMRNTRDHAEVPELRIQLGLDGPLQRSDVEETPPRATKRWSTSGLGAGLGRKLSSRRRSWAPTRSRSRNTEIQRSPARSGMEGVKEEETVTQEDALAKLEGKTSSPIHEENGPVPNSISDQPATKAKDTNSAPANGTANGAPVNSTPDSISHEAVVEEKILNGAAVGMVNGLTNGTANGHIGNGHVTA